MKTKKVFLILAVAAIALISGCGKKSIESDQLTNDQKVVLSTMTIVYSKAKSANDSLVNCSNPNHLHSTMMMNQYDSCYHANDSIFTICHSKMMGTNGGGMMSGNNGMMGGNNGGMMGGSNSGMMGNGSTMCNSTNKELNSLMGKMNALKNEHTKSHSLILKVK